MNHYPITRLSPAIEKLLNRDRIREARMLPEGKLSDEHHQQVRDLLDELTINTNGRRVISFAEISRAIGRAGNTASQWYNGKLTGDVDRVTRAINQFIDTHITRQKIKGDSDYVPTWVAEQMIVRVRLAHNKRKMLACVSPAGSGKSLVIQALAEEFQGYTVYCDETLSPKMLLLRIARACRCESDKRDTTSDLIAKIIERLVGRNTIVFIDEAQLLSNKCAGVIRSLYDQTGVTFALFGSQNIFHVIDDRDPRIGGGQFWSRTHKVDMVRQASIHPDDQGNAGRLLFTVEEVRALAQSKGVRLSRDGVEDMLLQIACLPTFGTLRLVCDLLEDILYLHDDAVATVSRITEALLIGSDVEAEQILGQVNVSDEAVGAAQVA